MTESSISEWQTIIIPTKDISSSKTTNPPQLLKDIINTPWNVTVNVIVIRLLIPRSSRDFIISKVIWRSWEWHRRVKCNISHGPKWVFMKTLKLLHSFIRCLHFSLLGYSRNSSDLAIASVLRKLSVITLSIFQTADIGFRLRPRCKGTNIDITGKYWKQFLILNENSIELESANLPLKRSISQIVCHIYSG